LLEGVLRKGGVLGEEDGGGVAGEGGEEEEGREGPAVVGFKGGEVEVGEFDPGQ